MILSIDPGSPTPAYEQIRDQVVAAVAARTLHPGTRLPTVRQLAGDLGLAANPVARAYRELETEGHVATRGRNGTIVLGRREEPGQDEVVAAATMLARAAQRSGLDLASAIGVLRHTW